MRGETAGREMRTTARATEAAVQTDESVEFPLPLLVPRPPFAFVWAVHPLSFGLKSARLQFHALFLLGLCIEGSI